MFQKYRFDVKKFKLGMRTLKTGIAVFLVVLLFHFLGWHGTNIAALTAVFSLREDFDKSLHFGASRVLGNSIGGFYAIVYFLIYGFSHHSFWVTLFVVPVCVMLTIMTNVAMNNKPGIIGGSAAMLIIALSIPQGDSIEYAIVRVFETFVGVFIAILVNSEWRFLQKIVGFEKNKH